MLKTHRPLWSTPHAYTALNNTLKEVAHGDTPDRAESHAIIAGERSPYILNRRQLWRPIIELKDISQHSLVLMADQNRDWKKGKLFWIKNVRKTNGNLQEKVLVRGLYLEDLLAMPWLMLTDAYLFSTTIEECYYDDGKRYFVYEPVIVEVKPYVQKIRKYIQVNPISSAIQNHKAQNIKIQNMFKILNGQIREDKEEK